jgi:DNA-binding response OmpR family regulator
MDFSELKNKKVLVVDDFANVRKSIKGQLQDLGFAIVGEAYDGDSASKQLKGTKFDLIVCDYNLGKGRDGSRLLEEWRTHKVIGQDTIFVLITAETSRDMVVSAMEFQPDDYLAKPFTMEVLANRLDRWFDRRQALLPLLVSLEKKDWEAVGHTARGIIESHPRYRAQAQKYFVESLIQQGQLTEAENFLHGLLDKRFQSWAQTSLHRLDFIQNKFEAAETGLRDVIRKDANLIEAYDLLADSLLELEKDEEVQEWLELAVQRAPKNISRQQKLVYVCQKNLEYRRASQALRDIVNMSAGTMHEHVGLFQSYIKNLQLEEANTENDQRKREISKEMNSISRRMNERYSNDPNSRLFSKALVVHRSPDPVAAKHTKELNELFSQTFEHSENLIADTALYITETFYKSERFNDADEMVRQFKAKFKDDPQVVKQFDDLQAEPVSLESRQKAKELNLKGIELYKAKEYQESIFCFRNAMEISPRHPGIILNFVQSHLLKMRKEGVEIKDVEMCLDYISRLNYLPEDHYQYDRYSKLKQNLKSMK